jgi:hypothetical protein
VENKGSFTIADSGHQPRLVCDRLVIKKPDAELIDSFLCMGVVNGKFLKIRTTMPQRSDSEAELQRFIGAWAERLWKVSSAGTSSP